jgi:hypothetical protein
VVSFFLFQGVSHCRLYHHLLLHSLCASEIWCICIWLLAAQFIRIGRLLRLNLTRLYWFTKLECVTIDTKPVSPSCSSHLTDTCEHLCVLGLGSILVMTLGSHWPLAKCFPGYYVNNFYFSRLRGR